MQGEVGWVLTRVNLNVASACPPEPSLPAFRVQTTNYVLLFLLEALWHKVLICFSSKKEACYVEYE